MQSLESERLELERQRREAETTRADFDRWAIAALSAVWEQVRKGVAARAEEFARATGRRIKITTHDRAISSSGGLPSIQVLELRLDSSIAYIYSHHVSGSAPHLHLGHWPTSNDRRHHHRMFSMPICMLERSANDDWKLIRSVPRSATGAVEVSIDDVIYRAFELVVFGRGRPEDRYAPGTVLDVRSGSA